MEVVITVINSIITTISYCFYYSFKTGQFLVHLASLLTYYVSILLGGCFNLLFVILESLSVFFQDISQGLQQTQRLLSQFFEEIYVSVSRILCSVENIGDIFISLLLAIQTICYQSALTVWITITQTFIFCKRLLVLFGFGVWFVITLIPRFLLNLVTLSIYYTGKLQEEMRSLMLKALQNVKTSFSNLYEFFTDVPIESLVGIIVAASLIYIFTQFYVIIFAFLYHQTLNTFLKIYHKLSRMRLRTLVTNTSPRIEVRRSYRRAQVRSTLNSSRAFKQTPTDERFCVICQERLKCILILPCRHVCMCSECNTRLQLYNNVCPICRNDIEDTMKIFV